MSRPDWHLIGVDFSCAPSRRKPITVARGRLVDGVVRLHAVDALPDLAAFDALLREPGPWLGGFDFPFGLPRAFVDEMALGGDSASVVRELRRRCPARRDFQALVDAWGASRPPGRRLLHRVTDTAMPGVSSSSPLQTRYVPVGYMYHEGLPRLLDAGVTLPRMHAGDATRQALEAYPGLLAFELIGRRSYKNADLAERIAARHDLLQRLEAGHGRLELRLQLAPSLRQHLVDDASGDRLDAALCLVQAAWASRWADHGLPAAFDPIEGWITTAPAVGKSASRR